MIYDKDIREPLFDYLESIYGKTRIIEEKRIGRARADLLMVTEHGIYGIEIKSDADSYSRLSGQVKEYDSYFDYNYVVVGSSHGLHIREHVPEHWGIITVEEMEDGPDLDFYCMRMPGRNPKMDWKKKLSLLWRPELFDIQLHFQMPKYKEKSKSFVIDKIIGKLPDQITELDLQERVTELLFERDYTKVDEVLKEYRKGEIQKKLEKEEDSEEKLKILMEYIEKRKISNRKGFRKLRKGRKR